MSDDLIERLTNHAASGWDIGSVAAAEILRLRRELEQTKADLGAAINGAGKMMQKLTRPEAAFGKWLETAEGKPEFGQRVIAWDGDWKQPCIMEYMGGALWASRFTHWMHIPLAPQNG